jgi:exodeoxyribonuclease VII large subunit
VSAITARVKERREKLVLAAASLDALSPLGVLSRGYAIAQDSQGRLLRDAEAVKVGDEVNVRLERGRLKTRVEDLKVE